MFFSRLKLFSAALLDALSKTISASIFAICLLFGFAVSIQFQWPQLGLFRYDALLIYALLIQQILWLTGLETKREALVIFIFHALAMLMELVRTHPTVATWIYPEPSIFKLWTVPLFAGFMYSAVGSFFARSLRLFAMSFQFLPRWHWLFLFAISVYLNFLTKHWTGVDIRYVLFAWSIMLFYRTVIHFSLAGRQYYLPALPVFLLVGFLIWIAENISTFYNIWLYPNQVQQWQMVGLDKVGSWYLLMMLSLVLVLVVVGRRNPAGEWHLH